MSNSNYSGPGSVDYRFNYLLDELEKRFPSTMSELLSSSIAPEMLFLKKIDELMAKCSDATS